MRKKCSVQGCKKKSPHWHKGCNEPNAFRWLFDSNKEKK